MESGGDRRSAAVAAGLSKQGWVGTQGIGACESMYGTLGDECLYGGGGMGKGACVKGGCFEVVGVKK